jgi:hypothetical protein
VILISPPDFPSKLQYVDAQLSKIGAGTDPTLLNLQQSAQVANRRSLSEPSAIRPSALADLCYRPIRMYLPKDTLPVLDLYMIATLTQNEIVLCRISLSQPSTAESTQLH